MPNSLRHMNNFDWLHGTWQTTQRKMVKPLSDSDEWETTDGTLTCHNLFDGAANVDEVDLPGFGFKGISLRLLDPATQQWSIYWVNSRNGQLALPPVVGHFEDGVGEFFSDEEYDGKNIRVRYRWSNITATTARWEQAFSTDHGETWETNWVSDFTR
jgi:hypothetical protein